MFRDEKPSVIEVVTLLVSAISLVSLVFLVIQTRQMTDTLESTVLTGISARESEMDSVFVEYPELQPYFFSGVEIDESNSDFARVAAIARTRVAFIGHFFEQSTYVTELNNETSPTWQAWKRYIRRVFASSPIMCRMLSETAEDYTPDFAPFASGGCGQ
jgi:hypothetical protein